MVSTSVAGFVDPKLQPLIGGIDEDVLIVTFVTKHRSHIIHLYGFLCSGPNNLFSTYARTILQFLLDEV